MITPGRNEENEETRRRGEQAADPEGEGRRGEAQDKRGGCPARLGGEAAAGHRPEALPAPAADRRAERTAAGAGDLPAARVRHHLSAAADRRALALPDPAGASLAGRTRRPLEAGTRCDPEYHGRHPVRRWGTG